MSSVQGSGSTISSGAIERVRKILDELDGKPALTDLAAAMRLRQQLEKNVTAPAAAAELVGKLSGTQRDVLREVLPSLPTVKAFFKDAFDRAPGPQDNVNNPDHGRARAVRTSTTTSAKINDGRTVDVAAIQGRLDETGEPASQAAARPRRRREVEDAEGAAPQAQRQAPAAASAAAAEPAEVADRSVKAPARKTRAAAAADAAGAPEAAANTDAAAPANADSVDAAPPTAEADGPKTASGAPADVPRDIHQLLDDTLDFIKMHLSPQSTKLYQEAMGIAEKLAKDSAEFGQERQAHAQLKAIPKDKRTPEQQQQFEELTAKLRGKGDPAKLGKEFEKIAKQWEQIPNHAGLLAAYYGLEKGRPSIDSDTPEGRNTLAFFDELVGRDTNLPPDIKAKIAAFRETDEGKRMLTVKPNMDIAKALFAGKLDTGNPVVQEVLQRVNGGGLATEADVAAIAALPPPPAATDPSVTKGSGPQKATGGAPPPQPPGGPTGSGFDPGDPSDPVGPPRSPNAGNAPVENDKWFNPLNRNWFGLSRIRHDQLKNDGHHELLHAIQEYNHKTQTMHMAAATRLNGMMALLNSGLPIESILLMFMGMMTENEEDKLRLKMAEIVVAEQFERTNRKLQADQNFARDLVKKYDMGVELPEHRENINREQLEKMAGLTWTSQVTPEDAARSNARGHAFKTLRADGMGKLQEKLDKIQFKDGVLDANGLKEVGLTPEQLKTAGIANQGDLDLFKSQAEAHSPKYIEDLIGEQPIQREARFVDVTLNPMDFGFSTKPSQAIVQELQVQMQNYKQIMETFTSVIRMLQDIVARITQNIR